MWHTTPFIVVRLIVLNLCELPWIEFGAALSQLCVWIEYIVSAEAGAVVEVVLVRVGGLGAADDGIEFSVQKQLDLAIMNIHVDLLCENKVAIRPVCVGQ